MPHLPSSPSMVLQCFLADSADYSTFSSNPTPPLCVASPLLFVIPSTPHLPLRRLLSPSDSHCKPEQQRTALLCGRRHETWRLRAGRRKKRGGEDSICSCCFHVSTLRDLFALTLQALLIVGHTYCFLFLSLPHSLSLFSNIRVAEDNLLVERQKLEADRADFAAHVSSASRAAEVSQSHRMIG